MQSKTAASFFQWHLSSDFVSETGFCLIFPAIDAKTFGCRFQFLISLPLSFPFFFWQTLYPRIPTMRILCTEELVSAKAKIPVLKDKHVKDGRQGPAIDRAIESSMRSRKSEVMTPTGSLRKERDQDREHHHFATEVKESKTTNEQALAIASLETVACYCGDNRQQSS